MGAASNIASLAGIYWSYSFSLWSASTTCGGPPSASLALGIPKKDGFSDSPLNHCVSDQVGVVVNDTALYIVDMADANSFTFHSVRCAGFGAVRDCGFSYSSDDINVLLPGCAYAATHAKATCGTCVQLGATASFMFAHTVSTAFYGILFGTLGAALLFAAYQARLRGWRWRNRRCTKVDIEAEEEAAYNAEQARRAALEATFRSLESRNNPLQKP